MVFSLFSTVGGLFLGWSIGAMDFCNVFGTAVSTRMLRFWNAAVIASVFCIIGAVMEGWRGIETLSSLSAQSYMSAIISSVAAALAITTLNILKLPISTSQAVVGSIIGVGIMTSKLNTQGIGKIVLCWIIAPVAACLIVIPLYLTLGKLYNSLRLNIFQRDIALRTGLILVGCYAAFALGANAVANISAVFVSSGMMNALTASLVGAISIAFGMLTFSKGVIKKIGTGLIKLDAFSSLVAVTAEAITVHIFSIVGVPVSTSQALIGAILGVGFLRGVKAIRITNLLTIVIGWILAPLIACLFAMGIYFISHLKYIPPVAS
jgi:PiT family inorganic phosphate transporter